MILAALERQSYKDFEVIIADDGSFEEVVKEINAIKIISPLLIKHLWQEDKGFRKTKILNESVRRSITEYLIFIDGDCIPHRKFVEEHYMNREEGVLLAGRRANLSAKLSDTLTEERIRNGYLEKGFTTKLLMDGLVGKSTHAIKGVYVKNKWLRKFLNRSMKGVLGCNFSIHKKDLLSINGFDERYEGPAVGEDTDIEFRLMWNNIKFKMVKNMAVQYHIFHRELERPTSNKLIFEEVLREKKAFTPFGITQRESNA